MNLLPFVFLSLVFPFNPVPSYCRINCSSPVCLTSVCISRIFNEVHSNFLINFDDVYFVLAFFSYFYGSMAFVCWCTFNPYAAGN